MVKSLCIVATRQWKIDGRKFHIGRMARKRLHYSQSPRRHPVSNAPYYCVFQFVLCLSLEWRTHPLSGTALSESHIERSVRIWKYENGSARTAQMEPNHNPL